MAAPAPAMAVLRRFPVVVAGLILGAAVAVLALLRMPPLHEAEAALLIELASEQEEVVPALSFDASGLLPLLEQRMRARAVSAEVAARLATAGSIGNQRQADPPDASPEIPRPPPPAQAPDEMQARIVTVGVLAPGAQRAAAATNEVTGLLLDEAIDLRQGAGGRPSPTQEEIERLARELEARGAALRAFLAERAGALPDSLEARQLALAAEESRLADLARADAALEVSAENGAAVELGAAAEGEAGSEAADQQDLVDSQRAEAEARIAELRRSIIATPANAANLAELRERFESLRSEFDQATQRLVAAEAPELVALLSRSPRVSVLAVATPPEAPTNRNRVQILAAGLGGGLVLGLGLALLLDSRDRSIRHPEEIATRLGLEPFATLPVLRSRRHGRGRRLALVVGLLGLLAIAIWGVHSTIMPVDQLANRLLEAVWPALGRPG